MKVETKSASTQTTAELPTGLVCKSMEIERVYQLEITCWVTKEIKMTQLKFFHHKLLFRPNKGQPKRERARKE